jgi:hypothetical protein
MTKPSVQTVTSISFSHNATVRHLLCNSIVKSLYTINLSGEYPELPENSTELPENSTELSRNSTELPRNSTELPRNSTELPENPTELPENSTEFLRGFPKRTGITLPDNAPV